MSIDPRADGKGGSVVQNEDNKFYSSGAARSFIRGIAHQLSEEDPEWMMEFLNVLDIANAALVSWLIEENEAESSCLWKDSAESREFKLAVERLKMTLAKLMHSQTLVHASTGSARTDIQ
jgi:hypothetical protein